MSPNEETTTEPASQPSVRKDEWIGMGCFWGADEIEAEEVVGE